MGVERFNGRVRNGIGWDTFAITTRSGGGYLLSRFRSIIGVVRFNFSVRNGKRWNPHANTT